MDSHRDIASRRPVSVDPRQFPLQHVNNGVSELGVLADIHERVPDTGGLGEQRSEGGDGLRHITNVVPHRPHGHGGVRRPS